MQKCILPLSKFLFLLAVLPLLLLFLLLLLSLLLLLLLSSFKSLSHSLIQYDRCVKLDTYLLQFLCQMTSWVKFFAHVIFYLPFLCSKATTFCELKQLSLWQKYQSVPKRKDLNQKWKVRLKWNNEQMHSN